MAGFYGDFVARTVIQGDCAVVATSWVPLTGTGTTGTPLEGRRHIRFQVKSNPGGALALQYVAINKDGTFTTPTANSGSVKAATIYPGNTTVVEPIGDNIQVFGRLVKKKGFTFSSIRVIVTELA
jgi:hypothetical protein